MASITLGKMLNGHVLLRLFQYFPCIFTSILDVFDGNGGLTLLQWMYVAIVGL